MDNEAVAERLRVTTDTTTSLDRPRSLSAWALQRVLTLHANGLGYRAIAEELGRVGIDVNWSTVRRAVKGWPPYDPSSGSTRTPNQVKAGNSSDIILKLSKIFGDVRTLDLTYGLGVFWKKYAPRQLTTNDFFKDADRHQNFTATDFGDRSFELVVFDPPFTANGPSKQRHQERYGSHRDQEGAPQNIKDVRRLLVGGIKEACRISGRWVLVKTQDVVESGQLHPNVNLALNTLVKYGFKIHTEVPFQPNRRPQPKGRRDTGLGARPSVFILAERNCAA